MTVHAQTVIQWFESFSPKHLAEDWDNVGLQVGTLQKEVHKVLVTLDVTEDVIQEAVDLGVELIIAHHPMIFKPLKNLRTDTPSGKILASLIHHDIAVYAAHTNLDVANGGVNDWLAERLGLKECEILSPTYSEELKKLAVFVPIDHEQKVRKALGNAGAGFIGNYSHCTFRTEGTGTFLPQDGANPYIGEQGKIEQVHEVKIETIFPQQLERKVIQAMVQAHPYEEVAYDLYPLAQQGNILGLGRIGYLPDEVTFEEFTNQVKKSLDVPACRIVGDKQRKIKKVAVLGGSGSKYISKAVFKGADAFVTGDVDFHAAHDALMDGICIIDPGHHVEKVMINGVKRVLQQAAEQNKKELEVIATSVHTDPFQYV